MKTMLPLILLCASACTQEAKQEPGSDVVQFQEPDAFYSLLRLTDANYVPLSEEQLFEKSEFIGSGRVVEVREGMKIRYLESEIGSTTHTLVIQLEVSQTIKGEADEGSVYIEYAHGGAFSVETYRANKPKDEALVFLKHPSWQASDAVEYVDQGTGYPKGATLYRLTTPQGWLIESEGGVQSPLESSKETAVFGTFASLAEVEQRLNAESEPEDAVSE